MNCDLAKCCINVHAMNCWIFEPRHRNFSNFAECRRKGVHGVRGVGCGGERLVFFIVQDRTCELHESVRPVNLNVIVTTISKNVTARLKAQNDAFRLGALVIAFRFRQFQEFVGKN